MRAPAVVRAVSREYRQELQRLARRFEPLFRAGWLRSFANYDGDRYPGLWGTPQPWPLETIPPRDRLERLCRQWSPWLRDESAAHLVLGASPKSARVAQGDTLDLQQAEPLAAEVMGLDLVAIARERGWLRAPRRWRGRPLIDKPLAEGSFYLSRGRWKRSRRTQHRRP